MKPDSPTPPEQSGPAVASSDGLDRKPERITLKKIRRWPSLTRHWANREVRIWSGEWEAWWRPGGHGYTCDSAQAGRWSFFDALNASRHAGDEKRIEYEAV